MDTTTRAARLESELKAARDIADAAAARPQGQDSLTAEEKSAIEGHLATVAAIKADDAVLSQLAQFDGIEYNPNPVKGVLDPSTPPRKATGRTLGAAFAESEDFKNWRKSIATSDGRIPDSAKGFTSPPVGFAGLSALGYQPSGARGQKDLVTGVSDTSGGALVDTDFRGLADDGAYARPLSILDVITRGQTGSDAVEYARVVSVTNNAAPVAEATSAGLLASTEAGGVTDAAGGLKPESAIVTERITTAVKTIAHWIPATKRALSDAAQIRTLIDNFLRYGLNEELEDQIINGDGTGENFTGILNTTGVQSQAWVNFTGTAADELNLLVTLRKAKTKARTIGRVAPNAVALNPDDVERLDLTQDNNGNFYFGGPAASGEIQRVWRVPVVEAEAVPAGVGIMGDWRQAVLWDREEASIAVTDSHADFFIRNLIAILAELRAAFGVLRPAAFVEVDLTAL